MKQLCAERRLALERYRLEYAFNNPPPRGRRRQPPMAIPSTDLIRMMTSPKTKSVDHRVDFDHIVIVHLMAEVVDRSSPWMRVARDH